MPLSEPNNLESPQFSAAKEKVIAWYRDFFKTRRAVVQKSIDERIASGVENSDVGVLFFLHNLLSENFGWNALIECLELPDDLYEPMRAAAEEDQDNDEFFEAVSLNIATGAIKHIPFLAALEGLAEEMRLTKVTFNSEGASNLNINFREGIIAGDVDEQIQYFDLMYGNILRDGILKSLQNLFEAARFESTNYEGEALSEYLEAIKFVEDSVKKLLSLNEG